MSKTIGIDVDDVVAMLIDEWLIRYNREANDRLTPEDLVSWEISEQVKPEWKEKIFSLLTPAMYDAVQPYPGTLEAVQEIRGAGHRVVFVTSCHSYDLFDAKVNWLKRCGFGDSDGRVVSVGIGKWSMYLRKQDVPGLDWLIDDHIGNLEGFKGYPVLQTRPHNRLLPWTGKRIRHLYDIVPLLRYERTPVELMKPAGFISVYESVVDKAGPWPESSGLADLKATNPKDAIGGTKVPLHFVSGIVKAYDSIAHYLGNVKYGAWNYRAGGARASVYRSALERHMDRWWEGEELDPVDGTPHLANAKACLNILIEAQEYGNLVDDRPPSRAGVLAKVYEKVEGMMKRIQEQYKDRSPKHYTIADTEAA